VRLTISTIRELSLAPGEDDKVFFDSALPCFGLRLRASGAKSWIVQYAIAGKSRRITLGSTAIFDPEQARKEARNILAAVRLGRDPALEKAQNKASAGETFGACSQLYLERRRNDGKLRPSSYGEMPS